MSAALAKASKDEWCDALYEELRAQAIEEKSGGGHNGLVLLLRQGVVAWMEHQLAGTKSAAVRERLAADSKRPQAKPLVSDEMDAGLVQIMASIALAQGQREAKVNG